MIDRILEWSARNRFLVISITVVLAISGLSMRSRVSLDAIPDLSDPQVIVYARWERSPDVIDNQVTFPIVSALRSVPGAKTVRGISDFGYSFIYVIFDDGTDLTRARAITSEYLARVQSTLPSGVQVEIGPDASALGWIYQYALVDRSNKLDPGKLRDLQEWSIRYWLQTVPGVAQVASIGGFETQYQVVVNPDALRAYGVTIDQVSEAIKRNNSEFGARSIEISGAEYMIRGRGYLTSVTDLEQISVGSVRRMVDSGSHGGPPTQIDPSRVGAPILLRHVATVHVGPNSRRGIGDLNGTGETVSGIVIMRHGENALNVIQRVKEKLAEISKALPAGVEIVTVYDRSELITSALKTVSRELLLQMIIMVTVIALFLWHFPSAIVPALSIPISIILTFSILSLAGQTINVMSLAGIAISIGVLVDGAIIEVENAYKRLEQWSKGDRSTYPHLIRLQAIKEVAPSVFLSALLMATAFLPVFAFIDQEGRLFRPLAISKSITMIMAAIMAITFDPALRLVFTRMRPFEFKPMWLCRIANATAVGRYRDEDDHPITNRLHRIYEPVCRWVLNHKKATVLAAVAVVLSTTPLFFLIGREFMPPLFEGSLLYMPTTPPGISAGGAARLVRKQDEIIKSFPEVATVFGKAGRADTATDPAPLSMMETVIALKPRSEWREQARWYSFLPDIAKGPFRFLWPDRISVEQLIRELDGSLHAPGISNGWTMPIRARIDMLATGIRSPVGVKVMGPDIVGISKIANDISQILRGVEGTRNVFAERLDGGFYLDIDIDRLAMANYGLGVADVEMAVTQALGGETVGSMVEGRVRHSINVRYARDFRDDPEKFRRVLVAAPDGAQIALGDVAKIVSRQGPAMIRNEDGMLCGYVFVDTRDSDIGGYVGRAQRAVGSALTVPAGYSIVWSGQYESMLRVRDRLWFVIPLTLTIIFTLLFINTKSIFKSGLVMLAVPFSLVGAFWYLYLLGYNISAGVYIGLIALMGMDAEMGVFMLMYLDLAYREAKESGKLNSEHDLNEAIIQGAVKRIRPKLMTTVTTIAGLLPIMVVDDIGSDLMKRIAAPLMGGLVTSFVLELLVYPPLYGLWRHIGHAERR